MIHFAEHRPSLGQSLAREIPEGEHSYATDYRHGPVHVLVEGGNPVDTWVPCAQGPHFELRYFHKPVCFPRLYASDLRKNVDAKRSILPPRFEHTGDLDRDLTALTHAFLKRSIMPRSRRLKAVGKSGAKANQKPLPEWHDLFHVGYVAALGTLRANEAKGLTVPHEILLQDAHKAMFDAVRESLDAELAWLGVTQPDRPADRPEASGDEVQDLAQQLSEAWTGPEGSTEPEGEAEDESTSGPATHFLLPTDDGLGLTPEGLRYAANLFSCSANRNTQRVRFAAGPGCYEHEAETCNTWQRTHADLFKCDCGQCKYLATITTPFRDLSELRTSFSFWYPRYSPGGVNRQGKPYDPEVENNDHGENVLTEYVPVKTTAGTTKRYYVAREISSKGECSSWEMWPEVIVCPGRAGSQSGYTDDAATIYRPEDKFGPASYRRDYRPTDRRLAKGALFFWRDIQTLSEEVHWNLSLHERRPRAPGQPNRTLPPIMVAHEKFGPGKIVEVWPGHMRIRFSARETRLFALPYACRFVQATDGQDLPGKVELEKDWPVLPLYRIPRQDWPGEREINLVSADKFKTIRHAIERKGGCRMLGYLDLALYRNHEARAYVEMVNSRLRGQAEIL